MSTYRLDNPLHRAFNPFILCPSSLDNAFEGPLLAQRFFEGDPPDLTEPASIPAATPPEAGAMRTILFTDVEGSTALTQRLGYANALELLRQHERIVR